MDEWIHQRANCITGPSENDSWAMLDEMMKNSPDFYQAVLLIFSLLYICMMIPLQPKLPYVSCWLSPEHWTMQLQRSMIWKVGFQRRVLFQLYRVPSSKTWDQIRSETRLTSLSVGFILLAEIFSLVYLLLKWFVHAEQWADEAVCAYADFNSYSYWVSAFSRTTSETDVFALQD